MYRAWNGMLSWPANVQMPALRVIMPKFPLAISLSPGIANAYCVVDYKPAIFGGSFSGDPFFLMRVGAFMAFRVVWFAVCSAEFIRVWRCLVC